jgi:hypothetical protein
MEQPKRFEIKGLIKVLKDKNYVIYDKPNQLNIVGVRSNSVIPNKFDDFIYVFFKDAKNDWKGYSYPATTDTGTYWLKNPMNSGGTALLKEGQYVDAYQNGYHKGQYPALVQAKPVTVFRDYNRDAILDFNNGKESTGQFGINIHRASASSPSDAVDKWSAGCQVFQSPSDFQEFMGLVKTHQNTYGNKFTYTLIDERAYNRKLKRYGVYFVLGGVLLLSGWTLYRSFANKRLLPSFKRK